MIILALSLALVLLTGCSDSKEKQVPIYTGMTISSSADKAELYEGSGGYSLLNLSQTVGENAKKGPHGDIKGHKDHDKIDKDDPFGNPDKKLEEEVKDIIDITESEEIFCAPTGGDVYIHIHIDNPDKFEIVSFTLNGEKYSDYMFEAGSDLETLILKYNVGDAHGVVEYTIDAIKYIDGTEIKDVKIEGDKTVKAGVKVEDQVTAEISELKTAIDKISFNVKVTDADGLIEFSKGALKAVLYDGDKIADTKDVTLGDNTVTFEGLSTNTLYQYAIVGYYDDFSGNGIGANVLYKDAIYTDALVLFDSVTTANDGASFTLAWNDIHPTKTLSAVKVYKNGELVKEYDAAATTVNGLLSAADYTLVAEYKNGDKTESISVEFSTATKTVPTFSISKVTPTTSSVSFELNETDPDEVGAIKKVELIHENGVFSAEGADVRAIENVLSNTAYTLKVTYVYDLNDGSGEQTLEKTAEVTTKKKAAPTFKINNASAAVNSVSAEYEMTDKNGVVTSYEIALYKGDDLVAKAGNDTSLSFSSLNAFTEYTIKINYVYDLNDGKGAQTGSVSKTVKTLPTIDVTGCDVLNTTPVIDGEVIFMEATLDNPYGVKVDSVVINGSTYNVTSASTTSKVFIEIACDGQFKGGSTTLTIEKVNVVLDDKSIYTATPASSKSDSVFVNGKLELLKVELVNSEFKHVDWAFPSDTVYMMITLDNPTGYAIDGVTITDNYNFDIGEWTKLDDNRYYSAVTTTYSGYFIINAHVTGVSYSNASLNKSMATDKTSSCYVVASDEVHYVSTPEDLLNMKDGFYYELKNDIDLSGRSWLGNELNGVFDGKGYSIKNMSYVGSIQGTNAYLGLFTEARGVITNVNMKGIRYIVKVTDGVAIYGALAARSSSDLTISNCTVDTASSVDISGTSDDNVGGLIGYGHGITITDCINNSSVTGLGKVGGIVGNLSLGTSENCTNNGSVTGTDFAGGIVGYADYSAIENCTNIGSITGVHAGGIAGYAWHSAIENCTNNGSVTGGCAGGIAGSAGGTIENCTNNGSVTGTERAGGIAGNANEPTIENCINYGKVTASSSSSTSAWSGGIVGNAYKATIKNCVNNGEVNGAGAKNGDNYVYARNGGIVGSADYSTIENCINNGAVTMTHGWCGGIAGYCIDSTVKNCLNNGDITGSGKTEVCGIISSPRSNTVQGCINTAKLTAKDTSCSRHGIANVKYITSENCYTLVSVRSTDPTCTAEQLNSKSFYVDTLGWSESVWNFFSLNAAEGKFPTLKD